MRPLPERTIAITGATSGLGRKMAEDLAGTGAALLLHGRDRGRLQQAIAEIRSATGNPHLYPFVADLASLTETERLADSFTVSQPRLDVLINNAGIGAGPDPRRREVSTDGYELRLAVNYLAPFLLTRRLLPLLRREVAEAGAARIVNVASVAQQEIDFSDPQLERNYDGALAYSQSKLALIMLSFDLAEELAGSGVTVNAVHPASLMDTRMVREWFGTPRTTVEEGAAYVERLAVDDALEGVNGEYFDQGQKARAKAQAYDTTARKRLRELSRRWIEEATGGCESCGRDAVATSRGASL